MVHTPDPAFRKLQRITIAGATSLPKGNLRVTAYVLDAGVAPPNTWIEVAEPDNHAERMLLLYGTPADAPFANHFRGRQVEIQFTLVDRVTLDDGREGLRIDLRGMRASTPAAPVP